MNVVEMKRQWFRECRLKDPERYREILDKECPETYGLPSYHDTLSCQDHTCEQCWKEALGNDNRIENQKAEEG